MVEFTPTYLVTIMFKLQFDTYWSFEITKFLAICWCTGNVTYLVRFCAFWAISFRNVQCIHMQIVTSLLMVSWEILVDLVRKLGKKCGKKEKNSGEIFVNLCQGISIAIIISAQVYMYMHAFYINDLLLSQANNIINNNNIAAGMLSTVLAQNHCAKDAFAIGAKFMPLICLLLNNITHSLMHIRSI